MTNKVLIFGSTGAIGASLIEIIAKEQPTCEIVAVSRSGRSSLSMDKIPTVSIVKGDLEDKDRVLELANQPGVEIVYCCVGFAQYERKYWAKHWPVAVDNFIAASEAHPNQKYVFCDNLYAYGPGTNISTSTTPVPASDRSKPAIRAQLRQVLEAYMKENPTRMTVVGAADFFGPNVTTTSFLGDTMTGNLCQGKRPLAIGSADVIHDFCYAPDFSKALYVASTSDKAYGRFWIAPHTIHGKTMRQIAADIGSRVGVEKKIQVLPPFMVSVLGLFVGMMAEFKEMLPFWTKDYTVEGGQEFTKEFSMEATPYDEAIQSLVDFYKTNDSK